MTDKIKKENKLKKVLKAVFVHNFGWKAFSLGLAVLLWVLAVGL